MRTLECWTDLGHVSKNLQVVNECGNIAIISGQLSRLKSEMFVVIWWIYLTIQSAAKQAIASHLHMQPISVNRDLAASNNELHADNTEALSATNETNAVNALRNIILTAYSYHYNDSSIKHLC